MPSFSLFRSATSASGQSQKLLAEVQKLLPRGAGIAALAEGYIADLSAVDLQQFTAGDLAATIQNLWQTGDGKPAGQSGISVYMPSLMAPVRWGSRHAVLDVVQTDMPFLIDSVTTALRERGLNVHLVVHPTVTVVRDGRNAVSTLSSDKTGTGIRESWAQFFFDACPPALLAEIKGEMTRIMQDVAHAVADWPAMRATVAAAREQLEFSRITGEADKQEAIEFLEWLEDNHFTYLGTRDYQIEDNELKYVEGTGMGVLRGDISAIVAGLNAMLPEVGRFTGTDQLLLATKTDSKATVHRAVSMDAVFVKLFDDSGKVVGERLLVGLLTSLAYSRNARDIPLLRQKAARVLSRAGLDPVSHNGKALTHILDTYPRDELFQIDEDDLFAITTGIMQLQERQRVALFVRQDYFNRFVTCLVYIPRENFDTTLRQKIVRRLEEAYGGEMDHFNVKLDQDPLMRLQVLLRTRGEAQPDADKLEAEIAAMARSWTERLRDALIAASGEAEGNAQFQRYANAFDLPYRDSVTPNEALADIRMIDGVAQTGELGVQLRLFSDEGQPCCGLKLYHLDHAVHLSTTLPMIENMGLKVATEFGPFDITLPDGRTVWLHDYHAPLPPSLPDIATRAPLLEEAFRRVWRGDVESDAFNRLVLEAGLDWREANLMRALAKYLRQIRLPFMPETVAQTLAAHPQAVQQLVQLFKAKFDPDLNDRDGKAAALLAGLADYIRAIPNLDEDRIISAYLNILKAAVRTNYYQTTADNQSPKAYLSIKFLSGQIDAMPLPKPYAEIFVYSPRVEAVHLRGGLVARGGIRWSDRLEDFRTEVLGLMKAQMVKNAVIVPGGSKGGFVVKQNAADPAAEGIACYRLMMQGLLDITDNYGPHGIIVPPRTMRHDGDDPYLVVAADKGTAKFSDIANEISQGYGFWLGDAFASGGSAGYDHKVMGITARGAWEAVKRHFRELGLDTQTQAFTVLGVGDMAGDVFGNGMLLSEKIELVAAFNYAHIFIDPAPDTAASFAERKRLFDLGRGSWDQYNASLVSAGGGIYPRSQKSIAITPQMKERFGLAADAMSPSELIRALLRSQVDLVYFGGIGTYIKAEIESDAMVGDKANDELRVNAEEMRARVIGEGANLGITQRGRIALAARGIRLNTDAIDNSAGVDTSDHEVNIKILTTHLIQQDKMDTAGRDTLLRQMTDEVAQLVLRDNYMQTQAISLAEARAADLLPAHRQLIQKLESIGLLNRALEFLPDDAELARRESAKQGLLRPELAVLLAYSKIWLYDLLLKSPLLDDPALQADLLAYFPPELVAKYQPEILQHRLAREITATVITNHLVNRLGLHAVSSLMQHTGADVDLIVRAYMVARGAFGLPQLWKQIEQLDNKVAAKSQTMMMLAGMRALEQALTALLGNPGSLADIAAATAQQQSALAELGAYLAQNPTVAEGDTAMLAAADSQLPAELSQQLKILSWLPLLPRFAAISAATGKPLATIIPTFMAVDERLQLRRVSRQLQQLATDTPFQAEAIGLLADDMLRVEQQLTIALTKAGSNDLAAWLQAHHHDLTRYDELVRLARSQPTPDFALWSLISRELLTLMDGD